MSMRLDRASWERTLGSVLVLTCGIVLPLLIIPIVRFARTRRQWRFVAWMAATLVGPVLLFFNLYYQHDYYAMAVSASVAILAAIGFAGLADVRSLLGRSALAAIVVVTLAVWVVNIPYWTRIYQPISDPEGVLPLAAQIERETDPGQPVAIIGRDWQPSILYYAHRWGWMLRGGDFEPGKLDELLADGYAVYRCPWLVERDHCDRVAASAEVPVPGATIGPVTGRTGLLESWT
jgi:hypothetical protein